MFEAIFNELSYAKLYNDNSKVRSNGLVMNVHLNNEIRLKSFAWRQTCKKVKVKYMGSAFTSGKQLLRLTNFALAALILQRSGDVALLLNPGSISTQLPKKHLHLGQVNVNGLRNKTMEIKDLLNDTGIHLLALTETKLDNLILDGSVAIEGYQFLKRNRNGHGGGIGLYSKDCLVCKVRNDLCSPYIEDLWVEICRPKAPKMLLGIFYCPPSANKDYMTHVYDSWDRATDENYETYVLGFTDHDLTVLSIKSKIPKGPSKVVYKRSYKHFSAEKFINDLKLIPFWLVESSDDPNEALDTFLNLFRDIADIHAPIRKYTVKSKPAPWITQNIRDLMLMRDAAKREAKVSGFPSDWAVYRKLRNHVVKVNRESKRAYFLEAINNTKKDPKSMWKTINNLLGRSNCPIPTYAESNGEIYTKPKDIANHFAKFFNEKIKKYRFEMSNPIDTEYVTKSITEIMTGKNCRFEFSSLSLLEVHSCLAKLPDTKVTGVDGIDNFLLRIASNIIAEPIRYIFNCSYAKSIFPDQWKVAKLHPIPKDKKQPFEDINSRPISLLNVL
ncbi:Hypothetical predicted protein, partial [Paramuricea clavata]